MTAGEAIARLLDAVTAEAADNAGAPVKLVSITFDWLAAAAPGDATTTHVEITRATRTLVFAQGQLRMDERPLVAATAVYRIDG